MVDYPIVLNKDRILHKEPSTLMIRDSFWYKDAVMYEVHVRAFCDSNRDGHGDIAGLTSKLDYNVSGT
jgi:maltose alpha-D-glucosyltransferase/alpha-amylase